MFFLGLAAARKEIEELKTSVNTLETEKREHVQSKYIKLLVSFYIKTYAPLLPTLNALATH